MDKINQKNIHLDINKTDLEDFSKLKAEMDDRMMYLENNFDKAFDKTKSLENWIDIYMPLRIQHQLTETIKECLPTKGKHLLAIADNLICNQLRDRVFTDIGHS